MWSKLQPSTKYTLWAYTEHFLFIERGASHTLCTPMDWIPIKMRFAATKIADTPQLHGGHNMMIWHVPHTDTASIRVESCLYHTQLGSRSQLYQWLTTVCIITRVDAYYWQHIAYNVLGGAAKYFITFVSWMGTSKTYTASMLTSIVSLCNKMVPIKSTHMNKQTK